MWRLGIHSRAPGIFFTSDATRLCVADIISGIVVCKNLYRKYPWQTGYATYRQFLLYMTTVISPLCCLHAWIPLDLRFKLFHPMWPKEIRAGQDHQTADLKENLKMAGPAKARQEKSWRNGNRRFEWSPHWAAVVKGSLERPPRDPVPCIHAHPVLIYLNNSYPLTSAHCGGQRHDSTTVLRCSFGTHTPSFHSMYNSYGSPVKSNRLHVCVTINFQWSRE